MDHPLMGLYALMEKHQWDGVWLNLVNPFLEQGGHWSERLSRATGFSGSSGCALLDRKGGVTLWVDGRYTLQAEKEVPHAQILPLTYSPASLPSFQVLSPLLFEKKINQSPRLCLNPWAFSLHQVLRLQEESDKEGLSFFWDDQQWVDDVLLPKNVQVPSLLYDIPNDVSFQEKCQKVIDLKALSAQELPHKIWLFTRPKDIAWLTNLRAQDQKFSPYGNGWLLVSVLEDGNGDGQGFQGQFFTDWPRSCQIHDQRGIEILNIKDFPWHLGSRMIFDPEAISLAMARALLLPSASLSFDAPEALREIYISNTFDHQAKIGKSALVNLSEERSVKNPWELHHSGEAHLQEALAFCKLLCWLDHLTLEAASRLTEWSVALRLESLRRQLESYQGPSFPSIIGCGAQSALIHYHPREKKSHPLQPGLLLIDAGGQYKFGTTDATRTLWILGQGHPPSLKHQERYTAVLQGHIHLASAIFPSGTRGCQLDAVARSFLWQKGLDYGHSTGHGVASFGHVHESPPFLSASGHHSAIRASMIFSNEPGFYEEGWGGIRLESLFFTERVDDTDLLMMKVLTMIPFSKALILPSMLSWDQKKWLNRYHESVYSALKGYLREDERRWLRFQTEPIL